MAKQRASKRRASKPRGPGEAPDLRTVLAAWADLAGGDGEVAAERYAELGGRALALGHAPLAYEILRHGLATHAEHPRLLYLAALASAKTGSYAAAADCLRTLLPRLKPRSSLYVEAKSLEGRIAKDRWARLPAGRERDAAGDTAVNAYEAAYQASRSYFPGINAATLNVLLGRGSRGRALAEAMRDQCLKALSKSRAPDPWLLATLGEACLLLDARADALRWYRRAARAAKRRIGDIATMRRQLKLISTVQPVGREFYAALKVPTVAVFTGHMLDHPGRLPPRFPPQLEAAVAKAIRTELAASDVGIGYCSAACGADILFIEEMQRRGAEVHVTLPFNREDFLATSVAFAGPGWMRRFERALERATRVTYGVRERYLGDDMLFQYTAALTQGNALLRAQQLETEALLIAVADPGEAEPPGGTRSTLASWDRVGLPARLIDLGAIRAAGGGVASASGRTAAPETAAAGSAQRRIRTMLFADMVGFSKLQEEDTPAFLVNFLGEIARVVRGSRVAPLFLNTWGDGLFLVFEDVPDAADFALKLRDAVRRTRWTDHGLPAETSIRIGMHTGPVFPAVDPILQRDNFFGSHVNRAARIEPVTAPGAVYVSEQTAALLAAARSTAFACDYLGSLPLAKHFGESVLYRLRRAQESE